MTDWTRGYSRDDFVSMSGGFGRTDRVRVWAWPGALLRSFGIFAGGEQGRADEVTAPALAAARALASAFGPVGLDLKVGVRP